MHRIVQKLPRSFRFCMHPKHVGLVDNNLQYMKFPNATHFLDMVVLWDPPFIIYNTPPWMTTHNELCLIKTLPRKNLVGYKKSGKGKRVQYSCEPLSAFGLPH